MATAKELVNKQSLKIEQNVLQMRILKDKAQFNPETSIFVRNLNPGCTEVELISEINQVFRYNLIYRNEMLKWETKVKEKAAEKAEEKKTHNKNSKRQKNQESSRNQAKEKISQYFVLGCLIIKNRQTLQSKRIAFIDFECADAAAVIIKAWNERKMEIYPNRLDVIMFNHEHIKMSLEQRRERSKTREKQFTNLFVIGFPDEIDEKRMFDIFFQYGEV